MIHLHEHAYGFRRKEAVSDPSNERKSLRVELQVPLLPYMPLWRAEDNFTSTYLSKEYDLRHRRDSNTTHRLRGQILKNDHLLPLQLALPSTERCVLLGWYV